MTAASLIPSDQKKLGEGILSGVPCPLLDSLD